MKQNMDSVVALAWKPVRVLAGGTVEAVGRLASAECNRSTFPDFRRMVRGCSLCTLGVAACLGAGSCPIEGTLPGQDAL
jgi:hypothetical protein